MSKKIQNFRAYVSNMPKFRLFFLILLVIFVIGAAGSLLVRVVYFAQAPEKKFNIGVIAPLSGPEAEAGRSVVQGIKLYLDKFNQEGGLNGELVGLSVVDEEMPDADIQEKISEFAADPSILGVIGHTGLNKNSPVFSSYQQSNLPLITPFSTVHQLSDPDQLIFSTAVNEMRQVSFLANFLRNVRGETIVSVIYEDSQRGRELFANFDKTLRRFGRKVVHSWKYPRHENNLLEYFQDIAVEIKDKKLPGTILVIGDGHDSAQALVGLRRENVKNQVAGLSSMDTREFSMAVALHSGDSTEFEAITDGLVISTPLLFDTADETAQRFKAAYNRISDLPPDWLAANAFDSAMILLNAAQHTIFTNKTPRDFRAEIARAMVTYGSPQRGLRGNLGVRYYREDRSFQPNIYIGEYIGDMAVSTQVQLLPITEQGTVDYLQGLRDGRLLYADNSFMYKTNVVKTGIQMLEVSGLDKEESSAELEFLIWFRYRPGQFSPENIVFDNAVNEISLSEPEKQTEDEQSAYSLYRVKERFYINYSQVQRPYGTNLAGFTFRHEDLTENNLMYVTDVLGMNISDEIDFEAIVPVSDTDAYISDITNNSQKAGWRDFLPFLVEKEDSSGTLAESLERDNVLTPASGWLIDQAWISQDNVLGSTKGEPGFIGFGKPEPFFSEINFAMILKPDKLQLRQFIPSEFFVYLAIFALVCAVAAAIMDKRERGQFWKIQILFLRTISWLVLLAAAGNLALDYALNNFSTSIVDMTLIVYRMLWWIVPAVLISISIERFVWTPIEQHSGRVVPNIIRHVVSAAIFIFACSGIIAFVFEMPLTSIIASSGVLTLVVGFAVQANIANIFSGVVLNVERPFDIGDAVTISGESGTVRDITWRTVLLEDFNGHLICIPNESSSQSNIYNYSKSKGLKLSKDLYMDVRHPPGKVTKLLTDVLNKAREDKPDLFAPLKQEVYFMGNVNVSGDWVNQYRIQIWANKDAAPENTIDYAWKRMFSALEEEDMEILHKRLS